MNNFITIIIISFCSLLFCQTKEYLDIGVIIHPNQDKFNYEKTKIDYMLSSNNKDLISKELKVISNQLQLKYGVYKDLGSNHIPIKAEDLKNITLLYLSENYISTIQKFGKIIDEYSVSNNQILIIADAIFRCGDYKRANTILNKIPTNFYSDEYWILKSLIHKELDEKESQKLALNQIINLFPNSDYYTVAKLQYNMISR